MSQEGSQEGETPRSWEPREHLRDQAGSRERAPFRGTPGSQEPGASPPRAPHPFTAGTAVLRGRAKRKRQPVRSHVAGAPHGAAASAAHRQSRCARLRHRWEGRLSAPCAQHIPRAARSPTPPAAAQPASPPCPRPGEAAGMALIAAAPDGSGHTGAPGAGGLQLAALLIRTTQPGRVPGATSHQPAPLAPVAWYLPLPAARGLRARLAVAAKVLSPPLVVGAQPVR